MGAHCRGNRIHVTTFLAPSRQDLRAGTVTNRKRVSSIFLNDQYYDSMLADNQQGLSALRTAMFITFEVRAMMLSRSPLRRRRITRSILDELATHAKGERIVGFILVRYCPNAESNAT